MDSLFFKEHFVKISNFFLKRLNRFPKILVQLKFIGVSPNSEHLGLFWSYLSHPTLESCIIFFMDSLFFSEHSIKILKFFSIGSTN